MTLEQRIEEIIEVIMNTAKGDTQTYCKLTGSNDMVDALAMGLNVMIDEINDTVKKKDEYLNLLTNKNKELDELTAVLEQSEKYHRTFFEKSEGFMCTHDPLGNMITVNEAGAKSIGYTTAELIGTNMKEIVAPEARHLFDAYLKNIREKKSDKGIMKIITRNGEERIWQYHNYLNDGGNEQYIIGSAQDITERVKMEVQLRKAKEAAEKSEKIKEQFLANTSHEIRTPMNAIIGFTELLFETPLNKEQNEYLNIIKTAGENLLVIIGDILDLSKIRSGKIHIEEIDFSLTDVVNSVVMLFYQKAKNKNIRFIHQVHPNVSRFFNGDPGRLKQVLINLLSNAFKFTEEGEVKLNIQLLEENSGIFMLEFSVEDSGIGIPADKLESVFESFTQATSDTTRKYGGSGLGLTIVKNILELQGGSISVKSGIGAGSKFIFKLPFKKATQKIDITGAVTIKEKEDKLNLKGLRVLLVEDNKVNQKFALIVLNKAECITQIAHNGSEAIEKLKTAEYDIVLMDIQMPGMDGYETTNYIRTQFDHPLNKIPIIALTAHALSFEIRKCKSAGMDDYISKPFEPLTLLNKIYALISKTKNLQDININPAAQEVSENNDIDFNNIKLTIGDDENVFLEMIDLFCEHIPVMMEDIKIQGLNKNWKLLKQAAHKLKPTVSLLGISSLRKLIESIEYNAEKETDLDSIPGMISQAEYITRDIMKQLNDHKDKLSKNNSTQK